MLKRRASGTSEGQDDDEARVNRKVKRAILPIMFLLYMCSYMDRATISYAQLQMASSLDIGIASYGTAASIFFVAYVLLEAPSNVVLARVGARLWLSRIAITWGIVTILSGFVWNTATLYAARVALGIAEAGLFPGLLLFMSYWFLQENRGRALAAMVFAQPVALILGSVSAGFVLERAHWLGLEPWQWLFVVQGLPPVLVGIYTLLFLPDRPSQATWLTPRESAWLEGRVEAENALAARGGTVPPHRLGAALEAFRTPRVLALSAVAFLSSIGNYGMAFFLPQVVQQMNPGYSPANIGFVGALPYICAGIAMLLVGRMSDRAADRRGIIIACLTLGVAGLVATMAFRAMPVPGIISLCVLAVGIVSYSPPMWAFITEALSAEQRVVVLALMTSIASFGGFVGPLLIGMLATKGNVAFGLVVPAVCLSAAILLLVGVRPPGSGTGVTAPPSRRATAPNAAGRTPQ